MVPLEGLPAEANRFIQILQSCTHLFETLGDRVHNVEKGNRMLWMSWRTQLKRTVINRLIQILHYACLFETSEKIARAVA